MYVPSHFSLSDVTDIHAFLRRHVFATIASEMAQTIAFAYAPIVFDAEPAPLGRVRFHLARANPLAEIADGSRVKLSIMGPHAYVSPDWYETPGLVPTWNYVAVEGSGSVKRLPAAGLRRLLSDLSAQEEAALAPKPPWTMGRVPRDRLESMLGAIVGFELPFDSLEGKAKLSQNRALEDAQGVIGRLEARGDAASMAVAAEMRKLYGQERG